jgi:CheY-like chemotaxis protein
MSTVLIAENEAISRDFLKRQLVGLCRILEATSPMEALDICRVHSEVDVLVCDAELGLVSGMELGSLLRAWVPHLRTILISDLPSDQWTDRQKMELNELPAGDVLIVEKPLQGLELRVALSTVMSEASVAAT